MQNLKLLTANTQNIETISKLAHLIWNQHYISIISQAQIDYMLNLMYSKESLKDQLEIKNHCFFLINYDGVDVGFISLNQENISHWSLNKFYINQLFAAKGIGSLALKKIIKKLAAKKLTLTVNRQNIKSINFYFKNGFKIEKNADFDIGNGYVMNDFIMIWKCI